HRQGAMIPNQVLPLTQRYYDRLRESLPSPRRPRFQIELHSLGRHPPKCFRAEPVFGNQVAPNFVPRVWSVGAGDHLSEFPQLPVLLGLLFEKLSLCLSHCFLEFFLVDFWLRRGLNFRHCPPGRPNGKSAFLGHADASRDDVSKQVASRTTPAKSAAVPLGPDFRVSEFPSFRE